MSAILTDRETAEAAVPSVRQVGHAPAAQAVINERPMTVVTRVGRSAHATGSLGVRVRRQARLYQLVSSVEAERV